MTSPVTQIDVECPRCKRVYNDWHRGSVNLDIEGWDAGDPDVRAYLRECETAKCPGCGHVVELETLIVDGNVWRWNS